MDQVSEIEYRTWLMFQLRCKHHIRCDDCNGLGGRPTLGRAFICQTCARLFHRT